LILSALNDPQRKSTLLELFKMMDKDSDKILTVDELTEGLTNIGVYLTPSQIESFHMSLDLTQDGIVTLNEFMEVMVAQRHDLHKSLSKALEVVLDFCLDPNRGADIKQLFKLLDKDKDGKLDPTELCNGLRNMGLDLKKRVERALFKELDQTKDGYITYDEFMNGTRKFHMQSVVYPALADGAWVSVLGYLAEDNGTNTAEELFNKCDSNGDMIVDVHELATGLLKSGVRLSGIEIRALHKTLDLDNDGQVTIAEFIESIEIHQQKFTAKSWKKLKNKAGEEYWYNEYTTETRWDVPENEEVTMTKRSISGPGAGKPPPMNPSKSIRSYR
jgi:calcium-binding protein CML